MACCEQYNIPRDDDGADERRSRRSDEPTASAQTPAIEEQPRRTTMKKFTNVRGASMVEYALLLFAVLIVAAAAIKTLGPKVQQAGTQGAAQLN
jgi:Flp pilus assembly pilin Flp